ncbi:hypothetical protein [Lysobacter humi (ex Lee et al. 2017)]
MPERVSRLPVPLWLFVVDGFCALALATGFFLRSAPSTHVPPGLPWVLIFVGGAGLIACAVAIARHLHARRPPPSP